MTREVSTITLGTGPTLSYAEQGARSGPALVLLPGPTDSWWSYQPVLERLPPSLRTIAVSQRGHGDSEKPATGYRVEDFAADVMALLDALRIERAVLAAHSGSCLVARRVAIDLPGRVAGLVLEASPFTFVGNAGLTAFVESVVSGLEDPIDPEFARALVVDTSSGEVEPELLDQLEREVLKVGRIPAPALLIWGDADGLIGREMQEQLVHRIPSAHLVVYPGVGHTPRWEDPARFAADVYAFVDRFLPARP